MSNGCITTTITNKLIRYSRSVVGSLVNHKWKRTKTAGELVYGTTNIMIKYHYNDVISCGLYSVSWWNDGECPCNRRFFTLTEAKAYGEEFYGEMQEIGMLS